MASYLQEQINEFYKFIGDILKIHHSNPEFDIDDNNENFQYLRNNLVSDDENIQLKIESMTPFLYKLLIKLYLEKGIKRKICGSIIQLFYDKTVHSYNKSDKVTQLCRHMVLDPTNLGIISLGVTKSTNFEKFKELNSDFTELLFEDYPDGTMCVYNPELEKYQNKLSLKVEVEDNDNESSNENNENNKVTTKNRDFKCSTRKVIGTGYFNSTSKTFQEMFNENNITTKLDLDNLPEIYKKNHSFVFNVQHNENRAITPINENSGKNILCAVFKFKSKEQVDKEWEDVINYLNEESFDEKIFNEKIKTLSLNMVEELDLKTFQQEMVESGLCFNIINNENCNIINKKGIETYEKLIKYANELDKFNQGIVIKNKNGMRTKIRNDEYNKIRKLKGHLPIMTEHSNIKNLFYIYWRLRQARNKSLTEFCNIFGRREYSNIFNYFNQLIYNLTSSLHRTYMESFVLKQMEKKDICYEFKPLCGDLHNMYKNDKKPITLNIVINYINNLPVSKIYWRIFENDQSSN